MIDVTWKQNLKNKDMNLVPILEKASLQNASLPQTETNWTSARDMISLFVHFIPLKGTGTRDLIWLKVVSLDGSWLVGLTDDL